MKPRRYGSGFSLVELLVTLAIAGVLLSLALPAFSSWMRNIKIRNQAESVLAGLQQARAEAVRSNRLVRFQLVSSMDNTCVQRRSGTNLWVVAHGDPAGECGTALPDPSVPPDDPYAADAQILFKGERERASDVDTRMIVESAAGDELDSVACFGGLGRLARYDSAGTPPRCTASTTPAVTVAGRVAIEFSDPQGGRCARDSGDMRCLRVMVNSGGESRLCDPALPQLTVRSAAPETLSPPLSRRDPRGCHCDPADGNSDSDNPFYCRE